MSDIKPMEFETAPIPYGYWEVCDPKSIDTPDEFETLSGLLEQNIKARYEAEGYMQAPGETFQVDTKILEQDITDNDGRVTVPAGVQIIGIKTYVVPAPEEDEEDVNPAV